MHVVKVHKSIKQPLWWRRRKGREGLQKKGRLWGEGERPQAEPKGLAGGGLVVRRELVRKWETWIKPSRVGVTILLSELFYIIYMISKF